MTERGHDGRFRRKDSAGTTGKLSAERKAAIIAGLEMGLSRNDAAQSAGIHRRTVNHWIDKDPGFADELDFAESRAKRLLTSIVVSVAAKRFPNTWQAAAWLMERRWPEQFAQKTRLDISLDTLEMIQDVADKNGLKPDELLGETEALLSRFVPRGTHR